MHKDSQPQSDTEISLFVCSNCEACIQATTFMQGWANGCPDVGLNIVSIPDKPEQIVRLGITYTPALVVADKLLAQNLSVDVLADLLRNTSQFEMKQT
jgi:hypothetical protein